jgi:hypothetical protein
VNLVRGGTAAGWKTRVTLGGNRTYETERVAVVAKFWDGRSPLGLSGIDYLT